MADAVDLEALERELVGYLRDEILEPGVEIDRETGLVSEGLVDSANLVRLATFLERRTGLEIPDRDVSPELFESVATILAYLGSRLDA